MEKLMGREGETLKVVIALPPVYLGTYRYLPRYIDRSGSLVLERYAISMIMVFTFYTLTTNFFPVSSNRNMTMKTDVAMNRNPANSWIPR